VGICEKINLVLALSNLKQLTFQLALKTLKISFSALDVPHL
jgi:hypothetical protein